MGKLQPPPTALVATLVIASTIAIVGLCYSSYRDTKTRRKPKEAARSKKSKTSSIRSQKLPSHLVRAMEKDHNRTKKYKNLAMKSPMYDNVRMYDATGELLCTISKKKGQWYVNKGLASWIDNDDDVTSIRLHFEPKARTSRTDNKEYVTTDKRNQCVVCGSEELHIRHYVVPFVYRTLLPKEYKSHMSHDIVIVCAKCHVECSRETHFRMNELESRYPRQPQFLVDQHLQQVHKDASALLKWRKKLPLDRIEEYEDLVRRYLIKQAKNDDALLTDLASAGELTIAHMQKALDDTAETYRIPNPRYVPGSELVINGLGGDEDKIAEFVRGWRRHFIDVMAPQNLPAGWSIDYSVKCGPD